MIGRDFADLIQGDGIRFYSSTGALDINALTVFAEQFGAAPLGVRNNSRVTLTVNTVSENINTFEIP